MKNRRQDYGSDVYQSGSFTGNPFFKISNTKDFEMIVSKKGPKPGRVGWLKDPEGYLSDIKILQNPNSKHSQQNKYRPDAEMDLKQMQWKYTPKQLERLAQKGRLYADIRSGPRLREYETFERAEREKLKKNSDYDRQINNTKSKSSDSKRKAMPPGRRTSASGKRYYERRSNRSDTLSEIQAYAHRKRGYY